MENRLQTLDANLDGMNESLKRTITEGRRVQEELIEAGRLAKHELVQIGDVLHHNLAVEFEDLAVHKLAALEASLSEHGAKLQEVESALVVRLTEHAEQLKAVERSVMWMERSFSKTTDDVARIEADNKRHLGAVVRSFDLVRRGDRQRKDFRAKQSDLVQRCRSLSTDHFRQDIGHAHMEDAQLLAEDRPDSLALPPGRIPDSFRNSNNRTRSQPPAHSSWEPFQAPVQVTNGRLLWSDVQSDVQRGRW